MEEHECSSKETERGAFGHDPDVSAAVLSANLWSDMRAARLTRETQAERAQAGPQDGSKATQPGEAVVSCRPSTQFSGTRLAATDLREVFKQNLPCLDLDHDGFLNSHERWEGFTSQRTDVQRMLWALELFGDELQELSDDEWGDENDGITLNDMVAFDRAANVVDIASTMEQEGSEGSFLDFESWDMFEILDADNNNCLSQAELSNGPREGVQTTPAQRLVLEQMRQNFNEIQEANNDLAEIGTDGITRRDIDAYYRQVMLSSETTLVQAVQNLLQHHRSGTITQLSDWYGSH